MNCPEDFQTSKCFDIVSIWPVVRNVLLPRMPVFDICELVGKKSSDIGPRHIVIIGCKTNRDVRRSKIVGRKDLT